MLSLYKGLNQFNKPLIRSIKNIKFILITKILLNYKI